MKCPDEGRARKEVLMRSMLLFLWLAGFVLRRLAAANEPRGRHSVHLGGVVPDNDVWSGGAGARSMKGPAMGDVTEAGGSFRLLVLLGAVVWLGIAAGTWNGWPQLGVIEGLFLLAPWIVVPLTSSLIPSLDTTGSLTAQRPALKWMIFAAAALATISFFLPTGILAASFAGAWLVVCALFALSGLRRLWRHRTHSFSQFCFAVGAGYLIVGGTWLVGFLI